MIRTCGLGFWILDFGFKTRTLSLRDWESGFEAYRVQD